MFNFDSIGNSGQKSIVTYSSLPDKPQINGVELVGNKSLDSLGIQEAGDYAFNMQTVENSEATTVTIDKTIPNNTYVYGTLTSLTIKEVVKSTSECIIEFTAGDTIQVTLPDTLQTVGNTDFTPNTKYVMSIFNNILVVGEMN